MKYVFIQKETDIFSGNENGNTLTLEFSADSISEMLEQFENFLKGAGYVIEGKLDIVDEDSDFNDYDDDDNDDGIFDDDIKPIPVSAAWPFDGKPGDK